jgi:hypothetical protein
MPRLRPDGHCSYSSIAGPAAYGQIHSFFRTRSPDQMLRTAAPRDRHAARQAYERASATADRLARGVRDLAGRMDRRPG